MAILREGALLGDKELIVETGRAARQAGGSVIVQYGETVVLITACSGGLRPLPFFPLSCDYFEKSYAGGSIPGNFFRREGRQGEHEILTSRLIDRPCRPLFPSGYKNETQIIATVLSFDQENPADVLAITGASCALMISDIPWAGPIAGVRVGRIGGKFVANPTEAQRKESDLDLVLACSQEAIVMVEGEADELSEEVMLAAMDFGFEAVQDLLKLQLKMREAVGKEKFEFEVVEKDPKYKEMVQKFVGKRMREAVTVKEKHARYAALDALKSETVEALLEKFDAEEQDSAKGELKDAFDSVKKSLVRSMIANEKTRIDGRSPVDIRNITTEVSVLPRTHGSSLFTRGETQSLGVVTLGTEGDAQRMDSLSGMTSRNFLLHYNFPPFCVGEVRPMRGPGRREIGHGTLARRALQGIVPTKEDDFPYTVRIVSEVFESNGSSSMATVCSGTMAMMDAGIPIKQPVAGIAMGLIAEGDEMVVLSDILGDEDHLGDMDFKVCGTPNGITAFQMDTKISGVPRQTMLDALNQARDGRQHILGEMLKALSEAREDLSPYAPRILTTKIKPSQIGALIGPGGRTVRGIAEQTGADISVEDDGSVLIASSNLAQAEKALDMIKALTQEPEVGKAYMGVVKKIVDFGAFIEILPGVEGLCHISELTEGRLTRVEDVLKEGEEVLVKCVAIDRLGKIKLSRREALAERGQDA